MLYSFLRRPNQENAGHISFPPMSESPCAAETTDTPIEKRDGFDDGHSHEAGVSETTTLISASVQEVQLRDDEKVNPPKERAPVWLAVFFDLAWTATFSNLTSNTKLITIPTLFSYMVFFGLAWWLWIAQVSYNIKYHRDDWFHRVMMMLQLFIFGIMATFTKDFDPFSSTTLSPLTSATQYPTTKYNYSTMMGISGLFACTRLILVVSYMQVLYYSWRQPKSSQHCQWLILQIATYRFSMIIFIIAFTVTKNDLVPSLPIHVVLWASGILVEVVVFLVIPDHDAGLRNENTMADRLITLTTIILGEGLNSNAGTLVLAASLTGIQPIPGGAAVSIGITIGLALALYVAGINKLSNPSKSQISLHFLLHLSLIVLLEALRTLLDLLSLLATIDYVHNQVLSPHPGEDDLTAEYAAFREIGIDLKALAAPIATGRLTGDDVHELVNKAIPQIYLKIFQSYQLADDAFVKNLTDYMCQNGTAHSDQDLKWNGFPLVPSLHSVLDTLDKRQNLAFVWIPAGATIFLFALGLLVLTGDIQHRQRYVTATFISRCIVGILVALTAVGAAGSISWKTLTTSGGLAHIVAASFALQYAVDTLFVWLTVRGVRKSELTSISRS